MNRRAGKVAVLNEETESIGRSHRTEHEVSRVSRVRDVCRACDPRKYCFRDSARVFPKLGPILHEQAWNLARKMQF